MFPSRRLDPEQQVPLKHIWRPLYALQYMYSLTDVFPDVVWGWHEKTDEQHTDAGYCLDRCSLIDALPRKVY